jgi:hypothetical protein
VISLFRLVKGNRMNRWLALVQTLAPILAAAAIPGPAGPIVGGLIAHGIEVGESMHDATGAEKLAHVKDLVNTGVAGVNAVRPNTVDPALVDATSTAVINASIQAANLIKKTPPPHTT